MVKSGWTWDFLSHEELFRVGPDWARRLCAFSECHVAASRLERFTSLAVPKQVQQMIFDAVHDEL